MKKTATILLLALLAMLLGAQEGPAYLNSLKVTEKAYEVHQDFGRDVLVLSTVTDGWYDDAGNRVNNIIYRANRSFLGREIKNIESGMTEILSYDYMNRLTQREVEFQRPQGDGDIRIFYDQKGRILSKISLRLHESTGEEWELHYGQAGYPESFVRIITNPAGMTHEKVLLNYYEEPVERHFYYYDESDNLSEIKAISAVRDSLIFVRNYSYDTEGRLIEEILRNHEQTPVQSFRMSYDAEGRLIQKLQFEWNPRFGVIPQLRRQWDYSYEERPVSRRRGRNR